jgi:hypothetical protein
MAEAFSILSPRAKGGERGLLRLPNAWTFGSAAHGAGAVPQAPSKKCRI